MFVNKTHHQSDQHAGEENDPPELPILNDDCIREIFRRLGLKDFLNMAQVCRQFAEIARQCIRAKYWQELIIADCYDNSFSIREARHSNLLQKFGHLADSIVWIGTDSGDDKYMYDIDSYNDGGLLRQEDDGFIFKAIIQHCSGNLKILDMVHVRFDHFHLYIANGSVFGSLEEIRLSGMKLYQEEKIRWLMTNFPKLRKVHLKNVRIDLYDLRKFLDHNQQIRSLELFSSDHFWTACQRIISEQFPHIEHFLVVVNF